LEARLGAALELGKAENGERKAEREAATVAESVESDAVSAVSISAKSSVPTDGLKSDLSDAASGGQLPPPLESVPPPLPGEEAEAAFLAEARDRGEEVATVAAALAAAEIEESKSALPPLEDLVQKLPAELRDTLDDLFRAKFVKVIRVRKRDLPA
jgi:hypothetical protein